MSLSIYPENKNLPHQFANLLTEAILLVQLQPDGDFFVSQASTSFTTRWNKKRHQILKQPVSGLFPAEESKVIIPHLHIAVQYNHPIHFSYDAVLNDQQVCTFCQVIPLLVTSARKELVCLFTDVTGSDKKLSTDNKISKRPPDDIITDNTVDNCKQTFTDECLNVQEEISGDDSAPLHQNIIPPKKDEDQSYTLRKTLDAILNSSSDCILFLDIDLRIVLCNAQAHRFAIDFLGRDVIEGEYVTDLLKCNRRDVVINYLYRAQNREEVITEEKIRFVNGEERWYSTRYYPTYNESGEYIGCVFNYIDIHQRKENELRLAQQHEQLRINEAAIRKAQNQFETLFNSSSDFILLFDADMNLALYNEEIRRTAIKFLGKKRDDSLTLQDLPEENRMNIERCIGEVKKTRTPVFVESKLHLPNETRLIFSKYFPVFDECGTYAGCTLIVTDVTSIKQKEVQIEKQNTQLKELLQVQQSQKEELRETKNILQAAINSSSDIIAFFDTNHNKVFCNLACEQFALHFWKRIINVGDPLFQFLPRKLHKPVMRCLARTQNSEVLNMEKMFRLPDGKYAWYSIRFFPTLDEKGTYIGSFINVCDITQRKEAELKLRRQNEELRIKNTVIKETKTQLELLINSSSDYIVLLDTEMKVMLFNETANRAALTYLNKPYAKGICLPEFLPVENRASTIQCIRQVKTSGKSVSIESRFALHHDLQRWLYTKFFPVYDEYDNYTGCTIIATDITSIKEKELQIEQQNQLLKQMIEVQERQNERLKESQRMTRETKNQLEAVISSSADNILFVNTEDKVILYNKAASIHFLKLSNKQLKQGAPIMEYIPEDKKSIFMHNVQMVKKKSVELEQQVTYPDGDSVWFYRKFYPVYNEHKSYIGYVINSANINKRKLYELTLARQNEQLREIARIQSHELRRPLANIMGLVALLEEESITEEDRLEFLKKIKTSTCELDNVIRKITSKTIANL